MTSGAMPSGATTSIAVSDALVGNDLGRAGPVRLGLAEGRIASITPTPEAAAVGRLAIPAPINAHDHGRPLPTTAFGAWGDPLEAWLLRLAVIPGIDPYLAAAMNLGRLALGGVAGAMMHYTKPQGFTALPQEAAEIARAAGDVGLRVGFAVAMRDRNPIVYGDAGPVLDALDAPARETVEAMFGRPFAPIAAQLDLVDAVAEAVAATGVPHFDVQYGPNGVQWCSDGFLEAIAERSATTGRRVHMHLLETKYQRDFADRTYPEGVIRRLKAIGLLSPRLTLAHGVYLRDDEMELLAEAGVTVSINTSSNLHLRSGIARVAALIKHGVKVAVGLDGAAFDEDDDMLREMRLLRALQGGWGFDTDVSQRDVLAAAAATGRATIGAPAGGTLAVGAPADVLVLDTRRLDPDAIMDVAPLDLLFARGTKAHAADLHVAGRQVVADGRLTGIDLAAIEAEVRVAYRTAIGGRADYDRIWPALRSEIALHYRDRLGCC